MPDVRILVTNRFANKVSDLAGFCCSVRTAVSKVLVFELPLVSVKLDFYAPGCEEGRPPVTVSVSINQGERTPKHAELARELANQMKAAADQAVTCNVGQVKVIFDLMLRKTTTAG